MSKQIDISTLNEMRASIIKWREHAPNNGIVLTDESDEQDIAVFEFQRNKLKTGMVTLPENDDVKICRCIFDDIKQQLFTVVVPYADDINWIDIGNRRNFFIFGDIIRAFAVFSR